MMRKQRIGPGESMVVSMDVLGESRRKVLKVPPGNANDGTGKRRLSPSTVSTVTVMTRK